VSARTAAAPRVTEGPVHIRTAPTTLARIAGLLYLIVAVFFIFAGLVNARIVERGDAAAAADNVNTSATLFRLGFVSELIGTTAVSVAIRCTSACGCCRWATWSSSRATSRRCWAFCW
jgi:hypothetical protein